MFDYHKKKGYADLYSLHSWCGILVFVLYFVQVSPVPVRAAKGGEMGFSVPYRGPFSRVHVQKGKEQMNLVGLFSEVDLGII